LPRATAENPIDGRQRDTAPPGNRSAAHAEFAAATFQDVNFRELWISGDHVCSAPLCIRLATTSLCDSVSVFKYIIFSILSTVTHIIYGNMRRNILALCNLRARTITAACRTLGRCSRASVFRRTSWLAARSRLGFPKVKSTSGYGPTNVAFFGCPVEASRALGGCCAASDGLFSLGHASVTPQC
jgi:hypothetical protein